MDISLLGLWLVCALGSAVFAAVSPLTTPLAVFPLLIGMSVGATWVRFQPTSPAAVELTTAMFAAWALVRGTRGWTAFLAAGLLAGFWTAALAAQGLPWFAARPLAATVALISIWLAHRRPAFVSEALRQEALLFLIVLGLVAAAAPGIIDGWHAGSSLGLQRGAPVERAAIPAWTIAAAGTALVSGGVYSLWSRR